jgi:hypothetical protein
VCCKVIKALLYNGASIMQLKLILAKSAHNVILVWNVRYSLMLVEVGGNSEYLQYESGVCKTLWWDDHIGEFG